MWKAKNIDISQYLVGIANLIIGIAMIITLIAANSYDKSADPFGFGTLNICLFIFECIFVLPIYIISWNGLFKLNKSKGWKTFFLVIGILSPLRAFWIAEATSLFLVFGGLLPQAFVYYIACSELVAGVLYIISFAIIKRNEKKQNE